MQPTSPSTPAPQDDQPTIVAGAVPAGPQAGAQAGGVRGPTFRERGRLRRRLRYLRRVRELGFRDLGGLVFDLHRFGRAREDLVQAKLSALQAVDHEMRALEMLLDDRRPVTELREAGISSCPRCGALHGSDARFCPSCGLQLVGARPLGEVGSLPGAAPVVAAAPPAAPPQGAAGTGEPDPAGTQGKAVSEPPSRGDAES